MNANAIPESIVIIAGKGSYPRLLAECARRAGVGRIYAVGFKKETDPAIERLTDRMFWVHLGQLQATLDAIRASGAKQAVMAGQITPTHLFRIRMDRALLDLLRRLPKRNAETIFGAIGAELKAIGVELAPAHRFMESAMPAAGRLAAREPTESEWRDIALGFEVAKLTSGVEIGQTVAVKEGTIIAVEAFEGTDETILRAGRLAGPGVVVVKVAKRGHDMRFDIPVVGERTLKVLKQARAAVLAVEAGKAILLDRELIAKAADRIGLAMVAVDAANLPAGQPAADQEPL